MINCRAAFETSDGPAARYETAWAPRPIASVLSLPEIDPIVIVSPECFTRSRPAKSPLTFMSRPTDSRNPNSPLASGTSGVSVGVNPCAVSRSSPSTQHRKRRWPGRGPPTGRLRMLEDLFGAGDTGAPESHAPSGVAARPSGNALSSDAQAVTRALHQLQVIDHQLGGFVQVVQQAALPGQRQRARRPSRRLRMREKPARA